MKEKDSRFILNTYGERELAFERGEGVYLWDVKGKRYLDFLSGIGVNILGYAHPRIIETIQRQARKLTHTSNLYLIPNQIKLAEKLVRNS
ncbi:MAG: aspartate aminotransferase family protein, partial [Thermoprotei archaeon]